MSKGSAPAAPTGTSVGGSSTGQISPSSLLGLQQQTANIDTNSPLGSQTYGYDPTTGKYTQNVSLNPNAQQALTGVQQNQGGLAGAAGQQIGNGQLGAGITGGSYQGGLIGGVNPVSMGDSSVQNAEQNIFNQQAGLLQPTFGIQQQQLQAQLANQGLTPGSAAYNNAENLQAQQQNNAYVQAAGAATQQGIGLQSNLFGQNLQNAQLGNSALAQEGNSALALNSGANPSLPQFQGYTAPNVLGTAQLGYNSALNQYNAQTGNYNSMLGGLFGLGNAGLTSYLSSGS